MSVASRPQALSRNGSRAGASGCADGSKSAAGPGSRRRGRNRSNLLTTNEAARKRGVTGEAVAELKPTEGASRRLAGAALAAAALHARGVHRFRSAGRDRRRRCRRRRSSRREAEISPAAQREHQRILAAYGGVYNDRGCRTCSSRPSTSWSPRPSGPTCTTRSPSSIRQRSTPSRCRPASSTSPAA